MKIDYWRDLHTLMLLQVTSLVAQIVKASAYSAGDPGSIPGSGRWRRKCQPTPVFLPGRRSLVGNSPWGPKESDMTEQLHFLSMLLQHYLQEQSYRNNLSYHQLMNGSRCHPYVNLDRKGLSSLSAILSHLRNFSLEYWFSNYIIIPRNLTWTTDMIYFEKHRP